jgi:hypothetical protein
LATNDYGCHTSSDFHIRTKSVSIFFRPKLRIGQKHIDELTDFRWPVKSLNGSSEYTQRRFVTFEVENYGGEPATNCQAKLNVAEQIDKCKCLSLTDKKSLLWENNDTKIDIGAKDDKPYFYLAFSQLRALLTIPTHCGIINNDVRDVQSWIATREALQAPQNREQDKMCGGRFRVHVEVFTEYGQRVYSDFIISVGPGWQTIDAEKCECKCVKRSRVRSLFSNLL